MNAHMRWMPREWQSIAEKAVPELDRGADPFQALKGAMQRALPPDRHHDDAWLRKALYPSNKSYTGALARVRGSVPPPAKPVPPRRAHMARLDAGREYKGGVQWTTREKALIARRVDEWRSLGDRRSDTRLIIEAQELVLPADRRRSVAGLSASQQRNVELLRLGRENAWLIVPPAPDLALVTNVENSRAREPGPVEPAQPPQATTPLPDPRSRLAGAIAAFGTGLMQGLQTLLTVQRDEMRRELLAELDARLQRPVIDADELGATIARAVASQVQAGMREAVHSMVEAELGPVTPPEPEPPPPEPAPLPPRLKLDVVGINDGNDEERVRRALNGSGARLDIRFIHPDLKGGYEPTPERPVIVLTERVSHTITEKIKAAGMKPYYARPTVAHVLRAVAAFCRSRGVHIEHLDSH